MNKTVEKGSITLAIIIFISLMIFFIIPHVPKESSQTDSVSSQQYCRPEPENLNAALIIDGAKYVKFKTNILLPPEYLHLGRNSYGWEHFIKRGNTLSINGQNFRVWYPSGEQGVGYGPTPINFQEYGILHLIHADSSGQEVSVNAKDVDGNYIGFYILDLYKDVSKPNFPQAIIECKDEDFGGGSAESGGIKIDIPSQDKSADSSELQLQYFLFKNQKFLRYAWWTPHCKPAIYLYPKEKTLVNVKVNTKGTLTYVDPKYPSSGWTVTAYPDGKIIDNLKPYDYLYYESKLPENLIKKPQKGWVVKYEDLDSLYSEILPKLGLNSTQVKDFADYWNKALKNDSKYYFVGIADQSEINNAEPLEITPKPDSVNRVRIYFERLDEFKTVEAPVLAEQFEKTTDQFKVVEWGGLIKNDKDHPFICSQ